MQRTLAIALSLAAVTPTLVCLAQQLPIHVPPPPPIIVPTRDSVVQAGAPSADSAPSREATMEFLRSFIQSRLDDRGRWPVEAVEAEGCTLRILYAKGRDRLLTFDLGDVDPQTIRADVTRKVSFQTTSAQPKISWQEIEWQGSTPHETNRLDKWTSLDLTMRTHEDQQRILRALRHGVKVCGGRVAPF
jgi:hypothetical protein